MVHGYFGVEALLKDPYLARTLLVGAMGSSVRQNHSNDAGAVRSTDSYESVAAIDALGHRQRARHDIEIR